MKLRILVLLCSVTFSAQAKEVKILTDRTEATLSPILAEFEKKSGVKVQAVYLENGLLNRLEARPDEADVVITKDAEILELAKGKNLLKPITDKEVTSGINPEFIEAQGYYVIDAYRARAIFYSKDRVKPSDLSTYEALTDGKWKGKICIRPGLHDYNVALFSQMFAAWGQDKAKAFIKGLKANLAREPKGNDREQAKMITEKVCDVALMNTYYHPIMAGNPEQKPWADATGVFYPDQEGKGTFIMRSAVGLTKSQSSEASNLLKFILSEAGETFMVQSTYQFPTAKSVKFKDLVPSLAGSLVGKDGSYFKLQIVPLADMARQREAVVKFINEIEFDKK